MDMERRYVESFVFLALLLGALALVVFMVLPYLNMLVLAAVLAFLLSGTYERLARMFHSRSWAALAMTLAVLAIIVVPLSLAGYRIAQDATGLYASLKSQTSGQQISVLLHQVQAATHSYIPAAQVDAQAVSAYLQQFLTWIVGHLGTVFTGITRLVLSFTLFLLFFFYFIRDGARFKHRLMTLSPLSNIHEQQILDRIAAAISGTLRGQVVLSFLQGIVAGCGFAFFSVPNPVLWGGVIVLVSFIPLIGTALVFVPAALYLVAIGHWALGVGLLLWEIVSIGLVDKGLGPKLMSHGTRLHPMVVLLAVLGGIGMFGPIGILIGPIVVSILFALLEIYLSLLR
jgi:predicted PurR-regulated permease PerM